MIFAVQVRAGYEKILETHLFLQKCKNETSECDKRAHGLTFQIWDFTALLLVWTLVWRMSKLGVFLGVLTFRVNVSCNPKHVILMITLFVLSLNRCFCPTFDQQSCVSFLLFHTWGMSFERTFLTKLLSLLSILFYFVTMLTLYVIYAKGHVVHFFSDVVRIFRYLSNFSYSILNH